mmetsp:Transcript_3407/g.9753  ORF Transcript_3407/g.9753 Transcript_3407/m.9753 type:complete len:300 (+) Transcript_3407:764-1663(+)
MEEGDAVGEGDDGAAEPIRPHPLLGREERGGHLPDRVVIECLVVMRRDVVDDLLRLPGVGDESAVDLVCEDALHSEAVLLELILREAANQGDSHLVHGDEKVLALLLNVALRDSHLIGPRLREQAGHEALLPRVGERRPSEHGVANSIVEGADACTGQVPLDRRLAPLVPGDLAELPALAVHQDPGPIDAVDLWGEGVQGLPALLDHAKRDVAHKIKSEAVDTILVRPMQHTVDHQAAHHGALTGGVVHAGRVLIVAAFRPTVVVPWHALVQDAVAALGAASQCVIVDDVHDDAQPLLV